MTEPSLLPDDSTRHPARLAAAQPGWTVTGHGPLIAPLPVASVDPLTAAYCATRAAYAIEAAEAAAATDGRGARRWLACAAAWQSLAVQLATVSGLWPRDTDDDRGDRYRR